MASATSLPCEEQLLCSICLGVFSEPVSTPCGHNYCKACITGYWASSDLAQCPLCKKDFRDRPQLHVNTGFRDMVEHFSSMRVRGEDGILAKPGEVPCDVCLGPKLKAQKTCLVCLASYCQHHLAPHQRVAGLKKHRLIDPVSNLEDWVCKKHDKMLDLFCQVDGMCVCFMCLKDDHATHHAVPLEHEFRERKARLASATSEIKMMEKTKSKSIKETKRLAKQSKKESEKEIAAIVEVFATLVVSLRRSQAELVEVIREKQRAAGKQAEDHVTQLEQEVAELRRKRSQMEQLLQAEDHLRLLQSSPSLCSPEGTGDLFDPLSSSTPPFTSDLSDISPQSYMGLVKKAVAQMEKTLSNEMEMLTHEVRLSDGCEAVVQPEAAERLMTDEFIKEGWCPPQDKLMMIQQCHAVDVTMDAYTANSRLVVSTDGKQLRSGGGRLFFHALFGRRFIHEPFVLGKDGFSSGRFYYEVQVSGSKNCVLGVVKESVSMEMHGCPTPEDGAWTFVKWFNYNSPLNPKLQTVGVFVDYEEGEVSFYDVDARTLIYSYTGCTFSETMPALQAFLFSVTGTSLSSRPKLYPFFGIYGDDSHDKLVITSVARTT
ncbi:E3 ubiquitin-protein ligase TRIM39-like [Chelmon rostratus]|uniref:E3 ubiquitin-protein ligase TRIM39-like n=1 Tax=Chelmon rostratus TaxID=109905 RepID=UPI001BEC3F58|nr:E3 ubiquitin-protein ligase TRIM39-like [Chelmon rostratus]XP_041819791.1 E3 ubiquitin-protein ligase TRIM39-like [Chelmon rostratus]